MMGERRIIPVTPNKRRAPALYELIGNKDRDPPEGTQPLAASPVGTGAQRAPTPAVPPSAAAVARAPAAPARPAPLETARPSAPAPAITAAPTIATPRVLEPTPQAAPSRPAPVGSEDDEDGTKVFGITPGSRLNIPVGFAFIAMAVVIAAVLGAYMLGYDKRNREARLEEERLAAREGGAIVDPTRLPIDGATDPAPRQVTPPTSVSARSSPGSGSGAQNPPRGTNTPANPPANTANPREPAPTIANQPRLIVVKTPKEDPRNDGMNYPTVASLPIKEATAAGEYLVSKGYATALVPSPSDSRLFMVIPLIGVERSNYQKGSEAAARTLRDLGRAFKRDQKGATDFNDLFWMKYDR